MNAPRRTCITFAVAALSLASMAIAQERRQVPEFRTYGTPVSCSNGIVGIGDFIDRYKRAWANEDTAGLIALHTSDTEWINAYARMFQGAKPLAEFLENRLFPAFEAETSREEAANMTLVSIRYMDDAAVVHMYTDGHRGASRVPGEDARRTHLHLVLQRQDCDWRVAHTAIMDAR